jgi:urease accessory protein UreH
MPWSPGTRWVFTGRTADGNERTVVTATDRTKVVDGVTTVVVHDVVYRDGQLLEDTYDWYAQDHAGNVWYFGEDTKEYDGKNVDTAGSWEAGVDGAEAAS